MATKKTSASSTKAAAEKAAAEKAAAEKAETITIRAKRPIPATMLEERAEGAQPDYYGETLQPGSQRTLPASVGQPLVDAGHAEAI